MGGARAVRGRGEILRLSLRVSPWPAQTPAEKGGSGGSTRSAIGSPLPCSMHPDWFLRFHRRRCLLPLEFAAFIRRLIVGWRTFGLTRTRAKIGASAALFANFDLVCAGLRPVAAWPRAYSACPHRGFYPFAYHSGAGRCHSRANIYARARGYASCRGNGCSRGYIRPPLAGSIISQRRPLRA